MGSEFFFKTTKETNETKLKKLFKELQDDDRHDNGHSYSGGPGQCLGLSIETYKKFSDEDAAKYLMDAAKKFGPCIAVSYRETDGSLHTALGAWCSS